MSHIYSREGGQHHNCIEACRADDIDILLCWTDNNLKIFERSIIAKFGKLLLTIKIVGSIPDAASTVRNTIGWTRRDVVCTGTHSISKGHIIHTIKLADVS